jgi:hypothetical protein
MVSRSASLMIGMTIVATLAVTMPHPTAEARARARCRPQKPQHFLMRGDYVKRGMLDPVAHAKAVRYRVERYGSIPGIAATESNEMRVASHVLSMRFFGLPVVMHEKVAPALSCVERRIVQQCGGPQSHYEPRAIGGLRTQNTIRQGEISNHLFGIAIDIDPDRNPCCHCVEKWRSNKKCATPAETPYDRADLPHCWVSAFEYFGFYWLGLDSLEDTMHFEFLGDPDKV